MTLPKWQPLPVALMVIQMVSMLLAICLHMVRHLGFKMSLAFFSAGTVIEWLFEILNIKFNGIFISEIVYSDILGPRIAGVPIFVPLLMAALLWPTFCCINLILFKRFTYFAKKDNIIFVFVLCMIYGFFHAAYSFAVEPMTTAHGFYKDI